MTCPREPTLICPTAECPGLADPGLCAHIRRISAWRSLPPDVQFERSREPARVVDPAVRDAVNACSDRGPVLSISDQDDCGCQGREVSLCRAGRGAQPGRVTLRDCLRCREAVTDGRKVVVTP